MSAKLIVYLDKVTNLADADLIGKSDPYVKFHLEQDNMVFDKNFGKKNSSKKKDDLNPVYGETFEFEFPATLGLQNMVLTCTVMDDDPIKDDKLGWCKVKLQDLGLTATPTGVSRVVDRNLISKNAEIFLRLSYVVGG